MTSLDRSPAPGSSFDPDDPVVRVRSPEDLVALVPWVLGFHPEESVVLLTFGGESVHARVDLPRDEDGRARLCAQLVQALHTNPTDRAAVVVFSEDGSATRRVWEDLVVALEEQGVHLVEVLQAERARWRSWFHPSRWHPLDLSSHPLTARRVLRGDVALPSREALAATLQPDQEAVSRVESLLRTRGVDLVDDLGWVSRTLSSALEDGALLDDEQTAQLLPLLAATPAGEPAWAWLPRERAAQAVDVWRDLTRRSPVEYVAGVAAVTAFCSWLAGQGALAWCAVDLARAHAEEGPLAQMVGDLLTEAVSPRSWQPLCAPTETWEGWWDVPPIGPGSEARAGRSRPV